MIGDPDDADDDKDTIKRLNRDITAKCGVRYPEEWRRDSRELQRLTNWRPLDVESVRELAWKADEAAQNTATSTGLSAARYDMLKERLNAWYDDPNGASHGGYVYDAAELVVMKRRLAEIKAMFARLNDPPLLK
jgi:hypothetical protein